MKVLSINGSPHLHGCTDRALLEFEKTLIECGVDVERVNVGNKDIRGCRAKLHGVNDTKFFIFRLCNLYA